MPPGGWLVRTRTFECTCAFYKKFLSCAHVICGRMALGLSVPGVDWVEVDASATITPVLLVTVGFRDRSHLGFPISLPMTFNRKVQRKSVLVWKEKSRMAKRVCVQRTEKEKIAITRVWKAHPEWSLEDAVRELCVKPTSLRDMKRQYWDLSDEVVGSERKRKKGSGPKRKLKPYEDRVLDYFDNLRADGRGTFGTTQPSRLLPSTVDSLGLCNIPGQSSTSTCDPDRPLESNQEFDGAVNEMVEVDEDAHGPNMLTDQEVATEDGDAGTSREQYTRRHNYHYIAG
ncbi:uncharacterized protein PITG_02914 [Phytophthora infestans T30-4]|uniref:SWIM-type domain-containing protein n=1 Tax=Phytophthora infestans (strain T30-4) TaxID=403677 RepID=D0MXH5_PHYIT|nr:uncharacterized protein PITG_02914 [Phytophthora infestans T30-4]EEY64338.1 hypothetical protein PITG_02914 [Phytophthora infestans T30-4]|eukprot:XP_002907774.1 hypothetical protein PITG_02914 [Phytophthora infestans T30-4]